MRKYFLRIAAIIMAIFLSAFNNVKKPDAKNAVSFYWFEYNTMTGKAGLYLGYGERGGFIQGPCHLIWDPECRRGYPATALLNQMNPSLGVIDDDLNQDWIGKHVSF
jgi:hypothetical protein